MQALVNDIGIKNGSIDIKVQDGKWTYLRFNLGYNRNECVQLEKVNFKYEEYLDK